ncbi:Exodeoxyribonuclease V beta chain [Raoultella terrigena]|uniref:Exodeoxyribonuclease V beta chain n=1 Tax=Raoultella terrigena TaxID=577 RepID=A0A4V6YW36_RAOTE|nr:Exodeoxyribonuclease V beta chain [Raoultella terrigena]
MRWRFIYPLKPRWTRSGLDALVRRYDPLSAQCPGLDFRQVRGMLKGFIDLVFRHNGRYYLLDYNPTGWGTIAKPTPGRQWRRRCARTAMIYSTSSTAWRCTAIYAIALLTTTMSAILVALFISFYAEWTGRTEGRGYLPRVLSGPLIDGLDALFAGEVQEIAS